MRKLVQNSHPKSVFAKTLPYCGAFLLSSGILMEFLWFFSFREVDAQGFVHEQFAFIPTGLLLMVVGGVFFFTQPYARCLSLMLLLTGGTISLLAHIDVPISGDLLEVIRMIGFGLFSSGLFLGIFSFFA